MARVVKEKMLEFPPALFFAFGYLVSFIVVVLLVCCLRYRSVARQLAGVVVAVHEENHNSKIFKGFSRPVGGNIRVIYPVGCNFGIGVRDYPECESEIYFTPPQSNK